MCTVHMQLQRIAWKCGTAASENCMKFLTSNQIIAYWDILSTSIYNVCRLHSLRCTVHVELQRTSWKCGFSYETNSWSNYCIFQTFWAHQPVMCTAVSCCLEICENVYGRTNTTQFLAPTLKICENVYGNVYSRTNTTQFLAPILEICMVTCTVLTCTVTTGKKLGSTSPTYYQFYTSPALNSVKYITYFTNKYLINFV